MAVVFDNRILISNSPSTVTWSTVLSSWTEDDFEPADDMQSLYDLLDEPRDGV